MGLKGPGIILIRVSLELHDCLMIDASVSAKRSLFRDKRTVNDSRANAANCSYLIDLTLVKGALLSPSKPFACRQSAV